MPNSPSSRPDGAVSSADVISSSVLDEESTLISRQEVGSSSLPIPDAAGSSSRNNGTTHVDSPLRRRNPKRSVAPTNFKSGDSDDDDDSSSVETGDEESYEETTVNKKQNKRRRCSKKKTEEEVQQEVEEEAKALKTLRSWMVDYEGAFGPFWYNPDKEFSYYSSNHERGSPHPKYSAVQLVDMMEGQLCDDCNKSLAAYISRSGAKACFGCNNYKREFWRKIKEPLAPSQAEHMFRFGAGGRHLLYREQAVVTGKRTSRYCVVDLYSIDICRKVAEKVHGGFFSLHLAIAQYRWKWAKNWPCKNRW